MTRFQKKLLMGLFIMALLSPLGILLPMAFKAGGAWGEWGTDEIQRLLGYVPEGMRKAAEMWKAPVRDYNFGGEGSPISTQIVSYLVSGFIGIIAAGSLIYLIYRLFMKKGK